MISITDKAKCCGCTACASICPRDCILMKPDFEGFLYPEVNVDSCVNCGWCEKVCPILNSETPRQGIYTQSIVMRTNDMNTLMGSTSGGFFTPFAEHIRSQGGMIFAATYDKNFNVRHLSWGGGKQQYIS